MPGSLRFFLCGTAGKRCKKKNTDRRGATQGTEVSFKKNLQFRGKESTVMTTLLSDNSRLLHENERLRREIEYFRASSRVNPAQDEELRSNIFTPSYVLENGSASENADQQARSDNPPLIPSEFAPLANADTEDPGRETQHKPAGGEEGRETAEEKGEGDTGDGANESTSVKDVSNLNPNNDCSAPFQETEKPGQGGQDEAGVGSPDQVQLPLPEKLISALREDFGEEFKSIRQEVSQNGRKTTLMLKKKTDKLSAGQRKLLEQAQSTHGVLKALGEALKSPQTPPCPRASKLSPHLVALALNIQDKFVTTACVKDFFRKLGMNPGNVEELATHAHSGPSGSRDLFWTMLVAHSADLSHNGDTVNLADMLDVCRSLQIATWQGTVMPRGHRRVLENKLVELVKTLRVDLLLPHLMEAGLMTSPGVKDYVTEGTTAEQVMKLLDILPLGGENVLEQLVTALNQTGQKHVAQIILGELDHCGVELRAPPRVDNSSPRRILPLSNGNDVTDTHAVHRELVDMFQGANDMESLLIILFKELVDIKVSVKHIESKQM